MENASKALLMAGGILIALMIIGALVLLGNSIFEYQNNQKISERQSQIAEFNNQFEPYNENNLTLMDLKSIYNKIKDNNAKNPEYEIVTNIESIYPDITKDFTDIEEEEKINRLFSCVELKKEGIDGRISLMWFEDVTEP